MRRFTIPSFAALSGSLTGCSDPIVGEWVCSEYDGEKMPYEYSTTDTYNGEPIMYSYSYGLGMRVFSDLSGHIFYSGTYSITGAAEVYASGGYASRIEISSEGGREYTIEISDSDSELECSLTKDELECEDEDDFTLVFEPSD